MKDNPWTYCCNNGDKEYLRRKKIGEGNNGGPLTVTKVTPYEAIEVDST